MHRVSSGRAGACRLVGAVVAVACLTALPARAELLDYPASFGNLYGDQPGVLDVDHWVTHLGQRVDGLQWWAGGYDELQGVAWSAYNTPGTVAHVDLRVLDGRPLRLDGFRLGSWAGAEGRVETVTVTPYGGGAPVYSYTGVIGLNNLSNRFDLGVSSATGFSIAWTNPWWTAIDDIRFQTAAVPEPGTAALLLAGLGAMGLRARRRRVFGAPPRLKRGPPRASVAGPARGVRSWPGDDCRRACTGAPAAAGPGGLAGG